MFILPRKRRSLASEVDKQVGDGRIILDPDVHVASDAKEGTDVGECLASGPVTDLGYLGVVQNAAFVVALVAKDSDFGDGDGELLGRYGGSSAKEMVDDAMDVVEVLPDEVTNLRVSWNGLIPSVLSFIVGRGAFDVGVVHKGQGGVRDLWLKDEDNITVEDRHGASPSLQQTS